MWNIFSAKPKPNTKVTSQELGLPTMSAEQKFFFTKLHEVSGESLEIKQREENRVRGSSLFFCEFPNVHKMVNSLVAGSCSGDGSTPEESLNDYYQKITLPGTVLSINGMGPGKARFVVWNGTTFVSTDNNGVEINKKLTP